MRQDHLRQWEHLLAWAEHAGVDRRRPAGGRSSAEQASARDETLRRALELREALYPLFRAVTPRGRPPPRLAAAAEPDLSEAHGGRRLRPAAEGFTWGWPMMSLGPMRILWPVVRSAAELLTGPDLDRGSSLCPGAGCGWLFLDKTRNGRRRWCEMEVCGSRAKMRRYHQRRRAAAAESSF